mmetsp:Transcript_9665/g.39370  ORF Transcript_9665/g.39370 Transcript_9665/m.39370 type:complete len:205 (-) Transcript_9665:497-1111(-)
MPRLCRHVHPSQLLPQHPLPCLLGTLLLLQALCLGLEPFGIVAAEGDAHAAVQLEDPAGHVIEEVAVVRDRHHGAREAVEVVLQPGHRLCIEVVGRLVQQQQVWLRNQRLAQRHPARLASGEVVDGAVGGRAAEGVHRAPDLSLQVLCLRLADLPLELLLLAEQLLRRLLSLLLQSSDLCRQLLVAVEYGNLLGNALEDVLVDS